MARRRNDLEEDPEELAERLEQLGENEDAILRDGQRSRVPMFLRNGAINPNLRPVQRAKAVRQQQQQTDDAVARRFGLTDGLALHRPGFRRLTDAAALARVQQAYADADIAAANAWRTRLDNSEFTGGEVRNTGTGAPGRRPNAPPGSYPYNAAAEGTPCTINGAPGTLVRQGNWLVCQPRRRQDAADAKAAAYAAYDAEMAVAYFRGK
jgi:hypothetical protein